jgi:hypothetical protein
MLAQGGANLVLLVSEVKCCDLSAVHKGHDDQRLPPGGPDSGQAGPEQTVGRAELGAGRESLVDGKLLAQGQVLEGELAEAADEKGEEPE